MSGKKGGKFVLKVATTRKGMPMIMAKVRELQKALNLTDN